tara:strand:- start:651 stop:860 length:210 start_codon:yes stop_codon:yes gene_type:complete
VAVLRRELRICGEGGFAKHCTSTSDIFALEPEMPFKLNCQIGDGHVVEAGNVGICDGGDGGADSLADQS